MNVCVDCNPTGVVPGDVHHEVGHLGPHSRQGTLCFRTKNDKQSVSAEAVHRLAEVMRSLTSPSMVAGISPPYLSSKTCDVLLM